MHPCVPQDVRDLWMLAMHLYQNYILPSTLHFPSAEAEPAASEAAAKPAPRGRRGKQQENAMPVELVKEPAVAAPGGCLIVMAAALSAAVKLLSCC